MKTGNPVYAVMRLLPVLILFAFRMPAEPPVLSNIESTNLIYIIGSGNATITKTLNIDSGLKSLNAATVTISSGFNASEDELGVANPNGISASWNSSTGVLTLSGVEEVNEYRKALRSVWYRNDNTNPSTEMRVVTFMVSDSSGDSNPVSRSIILQSPVPEPEPEPDPEPEPEPGPGPSPTAVISGTDSICEGEAAELKIAFTGTAPWNITLLLNGSGSTEISDIQTADYTLKVNNAGQYTLESVSDANSIGTASGTGIVILRSKPTASISGNAAICGEEKAEIKITLTGVSPWKFSYRLNNETPVMVQNVTSATRNIAVDKAGTYSLVEVYDKYCRGTVSGNAVISFASAPDVSISGLDQSYSYASTVWIPIDGIPDGGEFTGNGVLHYQDEWFFIPALAQVGTNNIIYRYRSSPSSCYGYDTTVVRVFEASAEVLFEKERTKFCLGDPPFKVTGINLVTSGVGSFVINGSAGLVDHGDNTATVYPSQLAVGQYTITYTSGDETEVDRTFEIGDALEANFIWDAECFHAGQSIFLTNASSSPFGFLTENSFHWNIYGGNDSSSWNSRDISYNFPEPGDYRIELLAENSHGCLDTAVKVLPLRPVIELANLNYFENFEGESGWQSSFSPVEGVNSWNLGSPSREGLPPRGFAGPYSGEKCWFTDLISDPAPAENSWITSPCYDFRGMQKPALAVRIWRSFTDNRDGSNLQYSTDNGRNWAPVGSLNDGINWYNSYFGVPGEQSFGWSSIEDTGWIETRHALDFLVDQPEVQFRIVYSALGSSAGNDGIAIDDIRIRERNRNTLIEHFTNSSDEQSAMADSLLNTIVLQSGSDVIDLQYHTSDPAEDPFNTDNPVIPSTRQFYYSLSDVPYTLINGGTESKQRIDYISRTLDEKQLAIESLYDSDFRLQVSSMIEYETLLAQATVTSLTGIPLSEISLRIVVVEPLIDDVTGTNGRTIFRNVVKAMLPDAAGNVLYKEWAQDESVSVLESWKLENVYEPDQIRVVAFIQDEATKEIYQTAADSRGIVTGFNDPPDRNDHETLFTVYPNPAEDQVFIDLSRYNGEDILLELYNNLGSLVYSARVQAGTRIHELSVDALPDGMYLLRASSGQQILGNRKVIISK